MLGISSGLILMRLSDGQFVGITRAFSSIDCGLKPIKLSRFITGSTRRPFEGIAIRYVGV
jgi:hypothetical protein